MEPKETYSLDERPGPGLIGSSQAMLDVYQKVRLAAQPGADMTVVIGGESGTGKELIAKPIDVRVIAATSQCVLSRAEENRFRQDLCTDSVVFISRHHRCGSDRKTSPNWSCTSWKRGQWTYCLEKAEKNGLTE